MTRRLVGVWARRTVDDPTLAAAMLEDVVDLVAGMEQVEGAVVAAASATPTARSVAWPGMPVLTTPDDGGVADGLAALAAAGADEALLVLPDAPDLPPLLLGKLFSALTSWPLAVCPASDGGLVAVAAACPAPAWLADGVTTGDGPDALGRLRAAAPSRGLHVGAGWHRVRAVADLQRLDPGLEGWEATRAWVSRR
jgi:glycosyltransferase A (GT-A) superfamily protein (DUF2064 family)